MHNELGRHPHIAEQDKQYRHDDDATTDTKQSGKKSGKNSGEQQGSRHHYQQIRGVDVSVMQYLWPLSGLYWALAAHVRCCIRLIVA